MSSSFRNVIRTLAPEAALRLYRRRRLLARARDLVEMSAHHDSVHDICAELWRYDDFRPLQILSEAVALFDEVQRRRPMTVLEIGAARGGTAFLFSRTARPDATILTLDLEFQDGWPKAIESFALARQTVMCVAGDSHCRATRETVTGLLGVQPVDVLFIDGDHSFEGVEQDFIDYSPLVGDGGLIIFHDIVEDSSIRHGVSTGTYVGGVPSFWRQIRKRYDTTTEIVEDSEQDGYGIGLLRWRLLANAPPK